MTKAIPRLKHTSAVVESFWVHNHRYISRYADCGKPNCKRCGATGPRNASHGPYWYLCFTDEHGRWQQIYLGKTVDTSRFVTSQGNLDLAAIRAWRSRRRDRPAAKPPGDPPLPGSDADIDAGILPTPLLPPPVAATVPVADPGPLPELDP